MKLGENIRAIRESLGWTIKESSEKTGIPYVTMQKYEVGKIQPTVDKLVKMAETFGVSIKTLIYDETRERINQQYIAFLKSQKLSDKSLANLISILNLAHRSSILDLASTMQFSEKPPITRNLFFDERKIFLDGHCERKMEIEVTAESDNVGKYLHRFCHFQGYKGRSAKFDPVYIKKNKMSFRLVREGANILIEISFMRPLMKGESAKFVIFEKHPKGTYTMTRAKIAQRIQEDTWFAREMAETSGNFITCPTDRLEKIVIFEKDYSSTVSYSVRCFGQENSDEVLRIQNDEGFSYDENSKTAKLIVNKPIVNNIYRILWEPAE